LFCFSKGDINKVGEKVLVARGGDGGMPSNQYAGQKGDVLSITLDLKLISDIGFVGYVVGRTFLHFVSSAKVKPVLTSWAVEVDAL